MATFGAISDAPPTNISCDPSLSIIRIRQVWGHSPSCEVTCLPVDGSYLTATPPLFNPCGLCTPQPVYGSGGGRGFLPIGLS